MSGEPLYRLTAGIRAAKYGGAHYLYDVTAKTAPLVRVSTQRVPKQAYTIVHRLCAANLESLPRPLPAVKSLFAEARDHRAIDVLVRRGYLEPVPQVEDDLDALAKEPRAALAQRSPDEVREQFDRGEGTRVFRPATFFNLPSDVDDDQVDVGLVGVPVASMSVSEGTAMGPAFLRALSQRASWFECHDSGVYSEISVDGERPRARGRGVVLKDFGDIGVDRCPSVGSLFDTIERFVGDVVSGSDIKPLFIGGDHAITYPIVSALLRQHEELCLIHLDAHNDLVYSERVLYTHSAPVSNLLLGTSLRRVSSFGLRTAVDGRNVHASALLDDAGIAERVTMHSIGATRRLLLEPERFARLLRTIGAGTPCYLSIDTDVLTPGEIAGRTSTPVGAGLDWWELYEAVDLIGRELNLIGADIVELNPCKPGSGTDEPSSYVALLILLIDRLAASPQCTDAKVPAETHKEKSTEC